MWYEGLFEEMEALRDAKQGEKMAAYMQNQFEFLGIPKPALAKLMKPYLKVGKKQPIDWDFVNLCWDKPYREAQYVAVEYVLFYEGKLGWEDLERVKHLIVNRSWWETVDSLDAVVGSIVLDYPELKPTLLEWSKSDNLWLRRVAIDFQQEYKRQTDTELLEQIIMNNVPSNEFFINKAIGWSLRDYSKTNPAWVKEFLRVHEGQLATLTVKEASKYLQELSDAEVITTMMTLGMF